MLKRRIVDDKQLLKDRGWRERGEIMTVLLLAFMMWQGTWKDATVTVTPEQLDLSQLSWQFCPADFQVKGCIKFDPPKLISSEWPPEPEPQDVPAIWYEVTTMRQCWLPGKFEALFGPTKQWCEKRGGWSYKPDYSRWRCADPSRVLLTAGDGTTHCIKFAEPK